MSAKLNDYTGANDWRWQAIDEAKRELEAASQYVELLRRRVVRSHSLGQCQLAAKHIKAALRRLEGERP